MGGGWKRTTAAMNPEQCLSLNTTAEKKHIIKRQEASQGINVSGCSVIAYNQIDVIIVRQPVTETAVIIRALTSSNTKLCNMAVS